jgi:uncharacterized membrane protein
MEIDGRSAYARAAALGAVAGMRSVVAPAVVSHWLSRTHKARESLHASPLRFLGHERAAKTLRMIAAGEIVVDKLPGMPDRTEPPILAARLASGALAGAAVVTAARRSAWIGALAGAVAAFAAAHLFMRARRQIARRADLPDPLIAAAEDVLAIGAGRRALR